MRRAPLRIDRTSTRSRVLVGYDQGSGRAYIFPTAESASNFLSRYRGRKVRGIYGRDNIDDAQATIDWLNERSLGYPVLPRLAHLVRS